MFTLKLYFARICEEWRRRETLLGLLRVSSSLFYPREDCPKYPYWSWWRNPPLFPPPSSHWGCYFSSQEHRRMWTSPFRHYPLWRHPGRAIAWRPAWARAASRRCPGARGSRCSSRARAACTGSARRTASVGGRRAAGTPRSLSWGVEPVLKLRWLWMC